MYIIMYITRILAVLQIFVNVGAKNISLFLYISAIVLLISQGKKDKKGNTIKI